MSNRPSMRTHRTTRRAQVLEAHAVVGHVNDKRCRQANYHEHHNCTLSNRLVGGSRVRGRGRGAASGARGRRPPSPRACFFRSTRWRRSGPRLLASKVTQFLFHCLLSRDLVQLPKLNVAVVQLTKLNVAECENHTRTPVAKMRSVGVLVWMAK